MADPKMIQDKSRFVEWKNTASVTHSREKHSLQDFHTPLRSNRSQPRHYYYDHSNQHRNESSWGQYNANRDWSEEVLETPPICYFSYSLQDNSRIFPSHCDHDRPHDTSKSSVPISFHGINFCNPCYLETNHRPPPQYCPSIHKLHPANWEESEDFNSSVPSLAPFTPPVRPVNVVEASPEPKSTGYISQVGEYDIVCGRGAPTQWNRGNQRFRDTIAKHQMEYLCAKRSRKPQIAMGVLETIQSQGGRFLRRIKTRQWTEISEKRAYEKVCQSLREGAPEIRRKLLASRSPLSLKIQANTGTEQTSLICRRPVSPQDKENGKRKPSPFPI